MRTLTMKRRAFVGGLVIGVAVPRLAFGQTKQGSLTKVEFAFSKHVFTATLFDNPSARDLASMLPLDLTTTDFSSNEKIAYLPRKLTEEGNALYRDARPGDLCYYTPWGNLAMFYASYSPAPTVIRLGRFDNGFEPLLTRGEFPLRLKLIS